MRILSAVIYFAHLPDPELIKRVCEVSKITHGHPRSQLACALYSLFVKELLLSRENPDPDTAFKNFQNKAKTIFVGSVLEKELPYYKRLTKRKYIKA